MQTRLHSLADWDSVASALPDADQQSVRVLRDTIEERARDILRALEPHLLPAVGSGGAGEIQAVADALDNSYLEALEAADGDSSGSEVVRKFAAARAAAALLHCHEPAPDSVPEALYELAAGLPDAARAELCAAVIRILRAS